MQTNVSKVENPTLAATAAPARKGGQNKKLQPPRKQYLQVEAENRLKAERVQEALKSMPGWKLVPGGNAIDRVRELPSAGMAVAFLRYASECAQQANVPVSLVLSDNVVSVTLRSSHRRLNEPLTEAALQVARMIG